MPRYFLDLCNGSGWLADEEGVEFADLDALRAKALGSVRDLIAADVLEGTVINLAHFIAARDEQGEEVFRLHFREAVRLQDNLLQR